VVNWSEVVFVDTEDEYNRCGLIGTILSLFSYVAARLLLIVKTYVLILRWEVTFVDECDLNLSIGRNKVIK
jgi:hypothetical protein